MPSKYAPFYREWGEEITALFMSRLEGGIFFFALGLWAGFYFPKGLYWGGVGVFLLLLFLGFRKHLKGSFFLLIAACFLVGISWASLRLKSVEHPTLDVPVFQISLSAEVEENLILPDQQILTVKDIYWPRPESHRPAKAYLKFLQKNPLIHVGDKITFQGHLFPLKSGLEPVGAGLVSPKYFEGIGAFGIIQEIKAVKHFHQATSFLQRLREQLAAKLFQILPENQARIAIPLMTGEQRFVSSEQYRLYRQAGITHVLSVSGFHMALLAGFLFFLIRGLCAWISSFTLHFNAKKIAAVLAWLGTLFYLLLSGAQVPALRSFLMISLVFLGILTDRLAFSKRSLFLVALGLLTYHPENILSISFQLSFLSVLVLIQVHEFCQKKFQDNSKIVRGVSEFLLLNFTITLALMPLIAGYFHLLNPYAFLGNLMFSTLFSFAIMPCLFIGGILLPIGSGEVFFKMAGYLLGQVEHFSRVISDFAFSEILLPSFPLMIVGLFAFGLVAFCSFRRVGKILALVLWVFASLKLLSFQQPDLLIYNQTFAWVYKGQFLKNAEGQKWIQNRWQKALGFREVSEISTPDFLWIKNQKIALKGTGCAGAKVAFLSNADARCHTPTRLLKPDTFYQVFINKNKIQIQESSFSRKTNTP